MTEFIGATAFPASLGFGAKGRVSERMGAARRGIWPDLTRAAILRDHPRAGVAELVDAPDSKSGSGNRVRVRVSPPAPFDRAFRPSRMTPQWDPPTGMQNEFGKFIIESGEGHRLPVVNRADSGSSLSSGTRIFEETPGSSSGQNGPSPTRLRLALEKHGFQALARCVGTSLYQFQIVCKSS